MTKSERQSNLSVVILKNVPTLYHSVWSASTVQLVGDMKIPGRIKNEKFPGDKNGTTAEKDRFRITKLSAADQALLFSRPDFSLFFSLYISDK